MSSSEKQQIIGQPVENEVLDVIKTTEDPLGILSDYGDNILHMSAAHDCHIIIKEILKTKMISELNKKNDYGWTPLMQAIRNDNIETVKLLLANGYNLDEETFEDISPIGLAAAMGQEMFEIVYSACPALLERAKYNKISPLCAAVLKEDRQLVLRLLELGVDVSEASEYTLMLMRQSKLPEIVKLAENYPVTEDYWTEKWDTMECLDYLEEHFQDPKLSSTLDNIKECDNYERDHFNDTSKNLIIPSIRIIPSSDTKINEKKNFEPLGRNIPMSSVRSKSIISPRLSYVHEQPFPSSPIPLDCGRKKQKSETKGFLKGGNICQDLYDDLGEWSDSKLLHNSTFNDESEMPKYKKKRPPNLNISDNTEAYLEYMSEASTSNNSAAFSETPKEPRCKTASPAMILDSHQKNMAILFRRFGLTHFLFTFLTQEVDLELFLTLNDQDLQEIGIEKEEDRNVILSVITECNRCNIEI